MCRLGVGHLFPHGYLSRLGATRPEARRTFPSRHSLQGEGLGSNVGGYRLPSGRHGCESRHIHTRKKKCKEAVFRAGVVGLPPKHPSSANLPGALEDVLVGIGSGELVRALGDSSVAEHKL
jgi:hypothetical protein